MAFTLPKIKVPKVSGRHRRSAAHRDAPGRPHPVIPPGGSTRRTNQSAREESRYRGEHEAGRHRRAPQPARPRDPFSASLPAPRADLSGSAAPRRRTPPRGAEGTPRARERFGPYMPRITDLAPVYRGSSRRTITPEQHRREEARLADVQGEYRARAERKRAAELRARAEAHEPPPPPRKTPKPRTVRSKSAGSSARRTTAPSEEEGKYGRATGSPIVPAGGPQGGSGISRRSKAFGHKLDEPPAEHHKSGPAVEKWFGRQVGRMEQGRDPGRHSTPGRHWYFDAT